MTGAEMQLQYTLGIILICGLTVDVIWGGEGIKLRDVKNYKIFSFTESNLKRYLDQQNFKIRSEYGSRTLDTIKFQDPKGKNLSISGSGLRRVSLLL
jgi:hypothetical protein